MKLVRRALFALLTITLIGLSPSVASASSFSFGGAGDDGMIIWDGDFDVVTMNHKCDALHPTCKTEPFGTPVLADLRVLLSLDSPVAFDFFIPALLLSVELTDLQSIAGTDLSVAVTNCGGFAIACHSADAFIAGHPNQDQQEINGGTSEGPRGVVLLPLELVTGLPVVNGSQFKLTDTSKLFLETVNPSLWAAAEVGFQLDFFELLPAGAVAVGFTLSVGEVAAPPAAVPEPASLILLGTGIAGLVARRRARRS